MTEEQRAALDALHQAHLSAAGKMADDIEAAGVDVALVRRIFRNERALATAHSNAASAILADNGAQLNTAIAAVKAATRDVNKRRRNAEALVKIVDAVGTTVVAAKDLVEKLKS